MTPDPSPQRQRGLGKGLAALLSDSMNPAAGAREGTLLAIPIEHLAPHPGQPRQHFDEAEIESLAASIRARGIVQPLVVRPADGDGGAGGAPYQIVAGERRWRAAQRAGIHEVPAVMQHLSDAESIEIALVENLQRRNLNPLEEASAYRRLIRDFGHRQEDVATALGKSRSHVANTVRLLDLPEPVKALIADGALSAGHGRALLGAAEPAALAETVVRLGLTVRQTETLVRRAAEPRKAAKTPAADPNVRALEKELGRALGLKVAIAPAARGHSGRLTIAYREPEQLDSLIDRLMIRSRH